MSLCYTSCTLGNPKGEIIILCYTSGTTGNLEGKLIVLYYTSGTTGNLKGKNKLFMPHIKNYW